MNTKLFLLAGLCLTALTEPASAQDERRLRNDPTYSTHNYKHANKAAAARRWADNKGVAVQQPAPAETRLADYKKQVPGQRPAGGITVDHTPSTDIADRNYKIQRVNSSANADAPNSGVATKRNRQKDTTSTTGGN